jgi:hypothetical protein
LGWNGLEDLAVSSQRSRASRALSTDVAIGLPAGSCDADWANAGATGARTPNTTLMARRQIRAFILAT